MPELKPGNFACTRKPCTVEPLQQSSGFNRKTKQVPITPHMRGIVQDREASKPDFLVIVFQMSERKKVKTLYAELPSAALRGIEM